MAVSAVPQGTVGLGECHTDTLPSDGSLQRNPRRNRQPRREKVPHPNPPPRTEEGIRNIAAAAQNDHNDNPFSLSNFGRIVVSFVPRNTAEIHGSAVSHINPSRKPRCADFASYHWVQGSPLPPTAQVIMSAMKELYWKPAHELAAMIRKRELKPSELMDVTIRRIEQTNPEDQRVCCAARRRGDERGARARREDRAR